MAEDNNSRAVWFLMGAAVGGAIALLFAPKSGRDTRRYIVKKTEESRDALADAGKELLDRGREYYEKGRKIAEEAGEVFERGRKLVKG
ncbi:MAG TPA: YtxH domain-containing protein [Bryobacteraceae bacterium]|nr:YtxH domain-containing protein [Bryobacteraceae bacterium]